MKIVINNRFKRPELKEQINSKGKTDYSRDRGI